MAAADSRKREMLKCSYLTKAPPGDVESFTLKKWQRRWFVLLDSAIVYPMAPRSVRLEYYENETVANAMGEPKGIIDLSECTGVRKSDRSIKGHKFIFSVLTNHRNWSLSADSAADRNAWVEMLHAMTADDYKAREFRKYLHNSMLYSSTPGPASGAQSSLPSSPTSSLGQQASHSPEQPSDSGATRDQREMQRPASLSHLHSQQVSPASEAVERSPEKSVIQPSPRGSTYTEVNLGRLPQKRMSAPSAVALELAPPIPVKSHESFIEEEQSTRDQVSGARFGASIENSVTMEQNGVEFAALQPVRFGASSAANSLEDSGEIPSTTVYQNLPSNGAESDRDEVDCAKPETSPYDHVVHQPSVRHKDRILTKQPAEDYQLAGGYSQVPSSRNGSLEPDGYGSVSHGALAGRNPYEEVLDFPRGPLPGKSPNAQKKAAMKRVSSLDMKKRLGVGSSPIDVAPKRSATVDELDSANDGYDHLLPSPKTPPHHVPRPHSASPRRPSPAARAPRQPSPSPAQRKPRPSPKPDRRSLSPRAGDTYDHLTPPGSPVHERRSTPNLHGLSASPDRLPGLSGPPPPARLSPAILARRRVSSPCILEDGNQPHHSGVRHHPRVPPKSASTHATATTALAPPNPGMRKSMSENEMAQSHGQRPIAPMRTAHRNSVPDLRITSEGIDDIYDTAS